MKQQAEFYHIIYAMAGSWWYKAVLLKRSMDWLLDLKLSVTGLWEDKELVSEFKSTTLLGILFSSAVLFLFQ